MDRVKEIINQLEGIGGARVTGFGKDRIKSLPDAVAKVLKMHYNMGKSTEEKKSDPQLITETTQAALLPSPQPKGLFDICPDCGEASFAHEEGCKKCYSCGYSECS
jgi:ribonucleoside-diphosphate reductase alpha chain